MRRYMCILWIERCVGGLGGEVTSEQRHLSRIWEVARPQRRGEHPRQREKQRPRDEGKARLVQLTPSGTWETGIRKEPRALHSCVPHLLHIQSQSPWNRPLVVRPAVFLEHRLQSLRWAAREHPLCSWAFNSLISSAESLLRTRPAPANEEIRFLSHFLENHCPLAFLQHLTEARI